MKMRLFFISLVVLAGLAVPYAAFAVTPTNPSSTFDFDDEGWTANGATVSHVASGGNPGGYLEIVDSADNTFQVTAPSKFNGDLSQYDGWIFSYDLKVLDPTTPITSVGSGLGRIGILGGGSNATFDYAGSPPLPSVDSWTTYKVPLTAAAFNTTQANWDTILSNITEWNIILEPFNDPKSTVGFDNATLTVTPEPASMALFGLGAGALALARRRKKLAK